LNELGAVIAGSIVAVVFAAFKLVERFAPPKNGGSFSSSDRELLKTVRDVITRTDGEGTPLTYFPRRLLKVMERQSDLAGQQTRLLEKMHDHLAAHEVREEELLTEMKDLLKVIVAKAPIGG